MNCCCNRQNYKYGSKVETAGVETEGLRSTPIPIKWKMTQDEENGNSVSPLQNGNTSRPTIQKTDAVDIADCKC